VNRRLRLALFLAALVATGPMPSARVIDAARADVGIAWLRSDRTSDFRSERCSAPQSTPAVERVRFQAHWDPVLPSALHSHSLFQRPPPLQN
jgi:hypothetical protein